MYSQQKQGCNIKPALISRRRFVTGIAGTGLLLGSGLGINQQARANSPAYPQTLSGNQFELVIGYSPVNFTGKQLLATAVNGSVPAPTLRWKEGERVTLRVTNYLDHDSSIHWHGLILPSGMDGVPGISFDGIQPGETFTYSFDVRQSGTYWYHSHSGFQEQTGLYGAIVIDPAEPDPVSYDRQYVIQLSDWSDDAPEDIYARLKKMSHYYNFRDRTVSDLWRDIRDKGVQQTWNERAMWNRMRMNETDIADVTGYTYTFLMNGNTPDDNWTGLFSKGEKVRLRFINSAAMTIFDVRIPGLKMMVVASDGQNIDPVTVDEFRIGVAETYDVIVEPDADSAYTVFAQTIDRSGFARGTLTPDISIKAATPEMDPPPVLGHRDMGMAHAMQDMGSMHHNPSAGSNHDHHIHQNHGGKYSPAPAGFGGRQPVHHKPSEFGPGVDMRAEMPMDGLQDPGIGLRDHQRLYGRRVLNYGDLCNFYRTHDRRDPGREIQLHLTGNMSRYMWSMDGIPFADAEPLQLQYGERVRITLVNDTMMTHPIHLHGMWSELETGDPDFIPRKHTVIVQPGSKISYLVTADARGRWAYHCHLMYHMAGMFREVRVE